MGRGEAMIVAGIGCRRGCSAEEIVALVQRAASIAGCTPSVLAAPEFKHSEPGLQRAKEALGLPLLLIDADALAAAAPRCATHSPAAAQAVGIASVAEGAALAAAGEGGYLILPRIATSRVTCALAESAAP
jgi:cobalt-precorrin 5A hydrolase